MSASTGVYVQILAKQNLMAFLKSSSAVAVKFCVGGIEVFSYFEGKWIFCKTKIICVTEISLE